MFNYNQYVQEFVSNNWLAVLVALAFLKGVSRQFKIKPLQKFYLILQDTYKIVRPGTTVETPSVEKPKK